MAFSNWLAPLSGLAGGLLGAPIGGFAGSALGGLASNLFANRRPSVQQLGGQRSSMQGMNPQMDGQQMNPQMGGYMSQGLPYGSTMVQTPNFQPNQMEMMNRMLQGGGAGMQNLPSAEFGPIGQAAMSDFYQQTVPGIAEQFTGAGAGGQRSSAFEQALGGAGAGLQERLAAMQQGFNTQQRQGDLSQYMNMLQMGMQPQYENQFVPGEAGFGKTLAASLIPNLVSSGMKYGAPLLGKYIGGNA